MRQLATGLLTLAIAFAVAATGALADADQAKPAKHKKKAAAHATKVVRTQWRSNGVFSPGPVYHSNEYLGDDPDPFIRGQLLRDLGAHYGPPD